VAALNRDRSVRAGLILLAGLTLLAAALVVHAILLETVTATRVLAGRDCCGGGGAVGLRSDRRPHAPTPRRIACSPWASWASLSLACLSVRYPVRFDLTSTGAYSSRTHRHDVEAPRPTGAHRLLRRPDDAGDGGLYQLIAAQTRVSVEFYDR
jgi:hypothetical protein